MGCAECIATDDSGWKAAKASLPGRRPCPELAAALSLAEGQAEGCEHRQSSRTRLGEGPCRSAEAHPESETMARTAYRAIHLPERQSP